jgi:hypothetical protein
MVFESGFELLDDASEEYERILEDRSFGNFD